MVNFILNKIPLVSIIIINYNGRALLENCFKSLAQVNYSNFETILVDNNSDDDSIQYVKENFSDSIIIKLEKNYGFAYPNNVGAKNAKGKYLLFLNNDTEVKPDFLSELVNTMEEDQKIGICQSMLLNPNGDVDSSGDFIDDIGISYSSKEKVENVREILSAKGASMMIRKSVFEKLGGFDEKFYISFEDVDLGWRSWILGYKVVIVPESIVYHIGGQTIKNMNSVISFHGLKNHLSMKITNFEPKFMIKSLFKFLIMYGLRELKIFFDYKFRGSTKITNTEYENKLAEKPHLKEFFKSFVWIFFNWKYLWGKHKNVNSNRKFTTQELQKINVITSRK